MDDTKRTELLEFTINILTVGLGAADLLHFLIEKKGVNPEEAAAIIFEAKRLIQERKAV